VTWVGLREVRTPTRPYFTTWMVLIRPPGRRQSTTIGKPDYVSAYGLEAPIRAAGQAGNCRSGAP